MKMRIKQRKTKSTVCELDGIGQTLDLYLLQLKDLRAGQ